MASRSVSRAARRKAQSFSRKPTKAQQERARRELEAQGVVLPEPGDPEFAEFLSGIIERLHYAEDVAITVAQALLNQSTTESLAAAGILQGACANELTEQIGKLEVALDCTSLSGTRLVINSNLRARRAQGLTPSGAEGGAS
jgi:hypothetical protein